MIKSKFLKKDHTAATFFVKFQGFSSQTWTSEKLTAWRFYKNPYRNPFPSSPSLVILTSNGFQSFVEYCSTKYNHYCSASSVFEISKIMLKMVTMSQSL